MNLEKAQAEYDRARARSEAVTPGGLHGDPATGSGVRRKPNRRKDAARQAAYRAEAEAAKRLQHAKDAAARAEAAHARAVADLSAHRDIDSLQPGDAVRDKYAWHRVVKVNRVSVSVATPWSWTDTIRFERIIETKHQGRVGRGSPASPGTSTLTPSLPRTAGDGRAADQPPSG